MAQVETVTEVREPVVATAPAVGPAVVLARIIYFVFSVIIAFIVLRFVFMLLGANEGNAIVDFIYTVSGAFVAPFYGIFNYTPRFGVSAFDVSSIVAIIVYALIAWALVSLVTIGSRNRAAV
jgi:uncharacterized protein YggT (Ycf19 family)